MTDRSSAIPKHLLTYANIEAGTAKALQERATLINKAITDFKARCTEFPANVDTPLAGRLNTHAENIGGLGVFAAQVGMDFLKADKGDPTTSTPQEDFSEIEFMLKKFPALGWLLYQDRYAWRGFRGGVRFQAIRAPGSGFTVFGRQLGGAIDEWRIFGSRAGQQAMGLSGYTRRIGPDTVNTRVNEFGKFGVIKDFFRNGSAQGWGPSFGTMAQRFSQSPPLMPAASFKTRIKGPAILGTLITLGSDVYEYGWGEKKDIGLGSRQFVTSATADVTAGVGIIAVSTAIGTLIPIPGVGTAIGFVVGVGLQYVYDRWLKDKWRGAVDWAGQKIQDGWNAATKHVSNFVDGASKKINEVGDSIKNAGGKFLKSAFGFG